MATKRAAGRAYRGQSSDERRRDRRERFVAAAIEVFGRDGYQHATVRSVCASAGLTERYFYESFDDTEALLVAAYGDCVGRLRAAALAGFGPVGRSPAAAARGALDAYFRFMGDERAAARIILCEVLGVSARVDQLYRQTLREFGELLVAVARSVLGKNQLLDLELDLELVGIGLAGSAATLAAHWLLSDYRRSRESMVDTALAIFLALDRELARRTRR